MRKTTSRILVISLIVTLISWGTMGVKLLRGNAGFNWEAGLGLIAFVVFLAALLIHKAAGEKCPHCGEVLVDATKTCPHCGQKL